MASSSEETLWSSNATCTVDINCRLFIFEMDIFTSNKLEYIFFSAGLNFDDFLCQHVNILIEASIQICPIVEQVLRRIMKVSYWFFYFAAVKNRLLRQLGVHQICKVIRLSLGLSHLSDVDQCVGDIFQTLLWNKTFNYLSSTLVPTFSWWFPRIRKVDWSTIVQIRKILDLNNKNQKFKGS